MSVVAELMNRRMRQVLVHSVLYYELNASIVDDHTFDAWCVELVDLIKNHQGIYLQHPFWVDFIDFDGSTGFQFAKHAWGMSVAPGLLAYHQRPGG